MNDETRDLRDMIAVVALHALLTSPRILKDADDFPLKCSAASLAYELADAMLEARKK